MGAAMNNVISMPPAISHPWEGIAIPEGDELSAEGVFDINEKGGLRKIAGPIWVSALTHDESRSHYGLVLRFIELKGNVIESPFRRDALHEQGRTLAQSLAARGCEIVPGQEPRLSRYLGSFNSKQVPWLRATAKIGWIDALVGLLAYVFFCCENGVIALEK